MADNEHATPSLGDAEMLAVQYPVGPPIPAVFQSREERPEVPPLMGTKKPWNILKQQPFGGQFAGHPQELPEEAGSLAREPGALAGDRQILTGETAAEEVNSIGRSFCQSLNAGTLDVAYILPSMFSWKTWPVTGKDPPAERVDLALEGTGPSGAFEATVKPAHTREQRAEGRHSSLALVGGAGERDRGGAAGHG